MEWVGLRMVSWRFSLPRTLDVKCRLWREDGMVAPGGEQALHS